MLIKSLNGMLIVQILVNSINEEKNGNKYLNIVDASRNSEILKKYNQVFNGIKYYVKKADHSDGVYDKDYMKIKFSSDDDIPLNKQINFLTITVIIKCVFKKDGKYYPQVYLDEYLCEVSKMVQY